MRDHPAGSDLRRRSANCAARRAISSAASAESCAAPEFHRARRADTRCSVTSSAAIVSLSTRSARNSGLRRMRSTNFFFPRDDSRLRAAQQLVSAEGHDRYARFAARHAPAAPTIPRVGQIGQAARAQIFINRQSELAVPSATNSSSDGRSVNPVMRKLEGCTRSSSRVRSLIARS